MKLILFDYRCFSRIAETYANTIATTGLAQILILCRYPYVLYIVIPPSLFTKLRVCAVEHVPGISGHDCKMCYSTTKIAYIPA